MESTGAVSWIMRSLIQYIYIYIYIYKFSLAYKNVKPKRNRNRSKKNRKNRKRKNKRYSKRRTNKLEKPEIERIKRRKLEVKIIEREVEEIPTQILNKRCIKKLVKNQNVELRKEYKEFILNATITISNRKKY